MFNGGVTLTRRHVLLLWAIAAWNVVSYANFAKNLWSAHQAGEDRPVGYWVAHTVLIVVNLVIAVVLARLDRTTPSLAALDVAPSTWSDGPIRLSRCEAGWTFPARAWLVSTPSRHRPGTTPHSWAPARLIRANLAAHRPG